MTDQHDGYNDYPIEKRQLCWAHIIRKFKKISERVGRAGVLGKQLWRLSRLIVHFVIVGGQAVILTRVTTIECSGLS